MVFDLTTKSLRILLNAVPIWIRPLAYGGPSCSTYNGRPARDARILWYSFSSSHRASILGSACGRLAFMEKAVVGRLTVCFSTTFCGSILGVTSMVARVGRAQFGERSGGSATGTFVTQYPRVVWITGVGVSN